MAFLCFPAELVVKMRPRGPAGLPHVADGFPLPDALARLQASRNIPEVRVVGAVAAVVPQHDELSVAAALPREGHDALSRGFNLRSCGCPVVDPPIGPQLLEHRGG